MKFLHWGSRLFSFSGVSSGSGSSDNGDNNDKCESPTPSGTQSQGSSNTDKRRPETRSNTRPRHLKPKKDIYKNSTNGITLDINSIVIKGDNTIVLFQEYWRHHPRQSVANVKMMTAVNLSTKVVHCKKLQNLIEFPSLQAFLRWSLVQLLNHKQKFPTSR